MNKIYVNLQHYLIDLVRQAEQPPIILTIVSPMTITIAKDNRVLGEQAGKAAAQLIQSTITQKGQANLVLATGTSQFETLHQLIQSAIDWSKVVLFHLDEYSNLPESHPASFRNYLKERFITKVNPLKAAYLINGNTNPDEEIQRLNQLITQLPIDVALVGIGENAHLAFNDPPADFDTTNPYLLVNLDEQCRRQQLNEGWFSTLNEVPRQAISMSIQQIMKAKHIICSVPDARKAAAVKNSIEQPITNLVPASILQAHTNCRLYLDEQSANLLDPRRLT